MDLLVYIAVGFTIFFGILTAILSVRDELKKRDLDFKNRQISQSLYELSVLDMLSGAIGYSLDLKKILETIIKSTEEILPFSTVSYAVLEDHKIHILTKAKWGIESAYTMRIQSLMLLSFYEIDASTKTFPLEGNVSFIPETEKELGVKEPGSYFNVPLYVNNKIQGMLTFSSTQKNKYSLDEMNMLYKIMNRAANAIQRLQEVIDIEKGRLDSLIASLPSGVVLFSFDKNQLVLATLNQAAKEFLGINEKSSVLDIFSSFGNVGIIEHIKKTLLERKIERIPEALIRGKYYKIFTTPVYFPNSNRLLGISLTVEDTSLEKQIEELRENFTHMVVHELRAPASSINGAVNLLLSHKLQKPDEDKMLGVIRDSSQGLLSQVNDLLDAAKMDSGKFVLKKEQQDVNALITRQTEFFTPQAQAKQITISLGLQKDIPAFLFDPLRINQVMNNLLSNSIKFTPVGGKITVKTARKDGFLEVIVEDSGMGIPQEDQRLLFSKFGQIEQKKNPHGTGLGLYIAKGIVESHGGKIWVESPFMENGIEQKGTRFIFEIPIELHDEAARGLTTGAMVN